MGMTNTATPYDDLQAALEFGLADRLAKSLQVSGVTTAEIAEAVDCSPRTVGNYTAGRTRPGRLVLREWAARTGVPLEWLKTGVFPGGSNGTRPNRPLSDYKSASPAPVVSLAAFASRFSPTPVGDGKETA